ncbi:MAG: bifunctional precorrin-2 dehydrogenase/sirohydrochlorin ferrochelatase, partial [Gammaproteobacteria bacterium]|nr:bifunctional precorrin-2 dehydrogenase/sirohydrochlorin ferrochelatase [Gammaproteobacteria bacterium]
MEYLPLHFDLRGRQCLLVGGGQVALRKARLLVAAGAHLTVIAPDINAAFQDLVSAHPMVFHQRPYATGDLEGYALIVVATSNTALNREISAAAGARQIPVNVVDQPALCSVIFPAIVDRDPVLLSVSSGGRSPVLTRRLRE